jgi:hypothetical protein
VPTAPRPPCHPQPPAAPAAAVATAPAAPPTAGDPSVLLATPGAGLWRVTPPPLLLLWGWSDADMGRAPGGLVMVPVDERGPTRGRPSAAHTHTPAVNGQWVGTNTMSSAAHSYNASAAYRFKNTVQDGLHAAATPLILGVHHSPYMCNACGIHTDSHVCIVAAPVTSHTTHTQ